DRPGGGRKVAGYDVEERRLAGAVGTENAAPLALADLEIDVLDCVKTAKTPAAPPEQEGRRGDFSVLSGFRHLPLDDPVDDGNALVRPRELLVRPRGARAAPRLQNRATEGLVDVLLDLLHRHDRERAGGRDVHSVRVLL